eukprot:293153-Chlamydomonas_euryale.AAC.6
MQLSSRQMTARPGFSRRTAVRVQAAKIKVGINGECHAREIWVARGGAGRGEGAATACREAHLLSGIVEAR